MKKIYLAGPDVFLQNAKEYGEKLKQSCLEHGFEGLFTLDSEISGKNLTQKEFAMKIQNANIELIKQCDIVIANLSSFRGAEPDSGTVWEVGFATGLGKKVIGYSNDLRSLKEKAIEVLDLEQDTAYDDKGMLIEDFGLSHNLMFADIVCCKSFEESIRKAKSL